MVQVKIQFDHHLVNYVSPLKSKPRPRKFYSLSCVPVKAT